MPGFLSVIIAILLFSILIFVHELGHFLAAKAFGVQVNEFSIGMSDDYPIAISLGSTMIRIGSMIFGERG